MEARSQKPEGGAPTRRRRGQPANILRNENKTSLDYAPGAELSAEADGGMPERC